MVVYVVYRNCQSPLFLIVIFLFTETVGGCILMLRSSASNTEAVPPAAEHLRRLSSSRTLFLRKKCILQCQKYSMPLSPSPGGATLLSGARLREGKKCIMSNTPTKMRPWLHTVLLPLRTHFKGVGIALAAKIERLTLKRFLTCQRHERLPVS